MKKWGLYTLCLSIAFVGCSQVNWVNILKSLPCFIGLLNQLSIYFAMLCYELFMQIHNEPN